ncbi:MULTISPECIES: hypothetical protein [unclassified Knoellia]|uniref:hypothetical protein n=1 Tax=Knoellia altitudinis TaxID=3404795 RepID=UPI0036105223
MIRSLGRTPATALALSLVASVAGGALALPTASAKPAAPVTSTVAGTDSDGDSLPDAWETQGYDADGNGTIDVDLPAMGANPQRKDVFVEMDYMQGRLPRTTAFDRIVQSFASAPVSNPDGTTGITIHLDAGSAGGAAHNLGGGNQVTYDANLSPASRETNAIKAKNFASVRSSVFYYMLWADDYDRSCSSGLALGIPADTFIVTMGPRCAWSPTEDMQVGTFLHELGHGLGLKHGGTDHVNYKPNYLSVMNYTFQFGGVPLAAGGSSFSYSDTAAVSLNESALAEPTGLGATASKYRTAWYCGTTKQTSAGAASNPIDWNCDNDTVDNPVATDINRSGSQTTLTAQDNWDNIVFGGGLVGGAGSRVATTTDGLRELTKREWAQLHKH